MKQITTLAKQHKTLLITIGVVVVVVYAYNSFFSGNTNPATVNLANPNDAAYKS